MKIVRPATAIEELRGYAAIPKNPNGTAVPYYGRPNVKKVLEYIEQLEGLVKDEVDHDAIPEFPHEAEFSEVAGTTFLGISGKPPFERGNCFTVRDGDGHFYKIVNFAFENLSALCSLGLTYPVRLKVIGPNTAAINDGRIGERWYQTNFCEVCTPTKLLPLIQRLKQERDIQRGTRIELPGMIQTTRGGAEKAEFP